MHQQWWCLRRRGQADNIMHPNLGLSGGTGGGGGEGFQEEGRAGTAARVGKQKQWQGQRSREGHMARTPGEGGEGGVQRYGQSEAKGM